MTTEQLVVDGYIIRVSDQLPMDPSPGQDIVRLVRHQMADILEALGEDVGPAPGEPIHAIRLLNRGFLVSPEAFEQVKAKLRTQLATGPCPTS